MYDRPCECTQNVATPTIFREENFRNQKSNHEIHENLELYGISMRVCVCVCNSRMDCVLSMTVALGPNPCSLAALTLTLWKNNSQFYYSVRNSIVHASMEVSRKVFHHVGNY